MKKKNYILIVLIFLCSDRILGQVQNKNLSSQTYKEEYPTYFEVRNTFFKIFNGELKNSYESYEIITGSDGNRWMYLKNTNVEGLKNDTYALTLKISKIINEMFFLSVNHNRSVPLNQNELASLLESYKIMGIKYETKEYIMKFLWKDLNW